MYIDAAYVLTIHARFISNSANDVAGQNIMIMTHFYAKTLHAIFDG